MTKYHINPKTGNPNVCSAKKKCPFGDLQADHYASKEAARAAYEQKASAPQVASAGEESFTVRYSENRSDEETGVIIKQTAKTAVFKTERGYHYKARLVNGNWIASPDRIMNPGNHQTPTVDSIKQAVNLPKEFVFREENETNFGVEYTHLNYETDDVRIRITTYTNSASNSDYFVGDGHVSFKTDKGWRTFDRLGVEDSFYIRNPAKDYVDDGDPLEAMNKDIEKYLSEKIPASRAKIAGAQEMPGTGGRLVTVNHKEQLAKTGSTTLSTGGFGTAYIFSTKPSPHARPATAEQKKIFNVSELWVEEELRD